MPRVTGKGTVEGVQAVVLALDILEFVARSQRSVGVTEISRKFETTKSRIFRHLQTLVAAGYLVHDSETERYRASARLMTLGQAVSEGYELGAMARPMMLDLRDKLGHSIALSVPESDGMRIIAIAPGKSNMEIGVKPGSLLGYHSSAQGKVALAFSAPDLFARIGDQPRKALTDFTITRRDALLRAIDETRERGWSVSPNESLIGLNALACPIFDASGCCAGAIAIVDSVQFLPREPSAGQIDAVRHAARTISAVMGFKGSGPGATPGSTGNETVLAQVS